jgi:mitochondrial fission protein ELM1
LSERAPVCWVVTEGIAGTENQCIGVAEALGIVPVVKRIKLRFPWKQLSPWLRLGHGKALAAGSDPIAPPWPDIALVSGRKAVGVGLDIKARSGGKTLLVQIQDPKLPARLFDLVVAPQHDDIRADNVLVTTAGLHRVTPEKLVAARQDWACKLAALPAPRVAVMIGGNSRAHRMTAAAAEKLADGLQKLAAEGAGLMVTASRRTGEANAALLRAKITGKNVFFWDGQGENPYFAFLALADYIIVTEDSVSMASEAISTGKPVYIAALEGGARRLDNFHRLLREQGYTRPFDGTLAAWSYDPPRDTEKVAAWIAQKMNLNLASTQTQTQKEGK